MERGILTRLAPQQSPRNKVKTRGQTNFDTTKAGTHQVVQAAPLVHDLVVPHAARQAALQRVGSGALQWQPEATGRANQLGGCSQLQGRCWQAAMLPHCCLIRPEGHFMDVHVL